MNAAQRPRARQTNHRSFGRKQTQARAQQDSAGPFALALDPRMVSGQRRRSHAAKPKRPARLGWELGAGAGCVRWALACWLAGRLALCTVLIPALSRELTKIRVV